ncbi:MAG: LemA family protein [Candidatus Omnitrophica bacterium]|nr:LemA family protein [Candidatus Omnitrophota bacterium]
MLLTLIIIVVLGLAVGGMYNQFIQGRIHVQEGLSGVDVQLKRRHNLIPNLVEIVKGYAQHESSLFQKVTELRSKATTATDIKEKASLENSITQALKGLLVVVEAYPDLKANQNFIELQKNLSEIEDEIQISRRYYNGTVRNLNILVQTFPRNIIANIFDFKSEEFFEVESATERSTPEIQF